MKKVTLIRVVSCGKQIDMSDKIWLSSGERGRKRGG